MEKLNQAIKKHAPSKNSLTFYQNISTSLKRRDEHFELSIYKGELTKKTIVESNVKLKQAFPALPVAFFDVFSDRIKDHKYNDERLKAAINHVIDNCVYPTPTIAQFIQFDKCMKLYNYDDILKMNDINRVAFETYRPILLEGAKYRYYAHINDIDKYKLTPWPNKERK